MIGRMIRTRWFMPSAVVLVTIAAATAFVVTNKAMRSKGDGAPTFEQLGKGRVTLADLRGRAVLLTVWATWCWSCREELPSLARLHRQWNGAPLAIVALSIDREGAEVVTPLIEQLGVPDLTIYLDPTGESVSHLSISGLPTTILFGPDGRELKRWFGTRNWDEPTVKREVAMLLGVSPDKGAP